MGISTQTGSRARILLLAAGVAIGASMGGIAVAQAEAGTSPREATADQQEAGAKRPLLGVKVQNVDKDTADALGLSEAKGALIVGVMPGGPADAAGLKANDTILAIDGKAISDAKDLANRIAELSSKPSTELKIRRGEGEQTVKVEFAKASDNQDNAETNKAPAGEKSQRLGLMLSDVAGDEGVLIADVDPQSDAASKGLKSGDLILQVDGAPAASAEDLAKSVNAIREKGRQAVLLLVKSGDQTRTVAVRFGMLG
jgi:serine protease Do